MKTVTLTKQMIGDLQTSYGGFTAATLSALGIAWPPAQKWRRKLVGTSITEEAYEAALAGKSVIRPKTAKTRRKKTAAINANVTNSRLNAAFDAAVLRSEPQGEG